MVFVIIWDSDKFESTKKVLGSFLISMKLDLLEKYSFLLTSMYGPNKPDWRKDV